MAIGCRLAVRFRRLGKDADELGVGSRFSLWPRDFSCWIFCCSLSSRERSAVFALPLVIKTPRGYPAGGLFCRHFGVIA